MDPALVELFEDDSDELCEICFARKAIGTFNVDDTETPVCAHCSTLRNHDGTQVVIPYSSY
jgi:hypothetical protein